MLEIRLRHRFDAFTLDVDFAAPPGLTALFGPSGAGKTSIIQAVAGLLRPAEARIALDGTVLADSAARRFVPPHRRRIGYVFQESRLFPHLTVRRNLLYGRWFAPPAARRDDLDAVAALLGIEALLERYPARLSGGEAQRVAIGRALLSAPRLLLMDEPLAALDTARRAEILPYVERLRDEARIPILYVSHAIAEVARLATTVVLLAGGRVAGIGAPDTLLARSDLLDPGDRGAAGAVLTAHVAGQDAPFALTLLSAAGGTLRVPRIDLPPGTPVRVRIQARDVMLTTAPPAGISALNQLAGTVTHIATVDESSVDVRLDCGGAALVARLTRRAVHDLALVPGMPVHAVVKSMALDPG